MLVSPHCAPLLAEDTRFFWYPPVLIRIGNSLQRKLLQATHETSSVTETDIRPIAKGLGVAVVVGNPSDVLAVASTFQPDVLFSMYYRHILPDDLLALPKIGSFNFHPSILPRHRGCKTNVWAIIDGDRNAGVTCHRMTSKVDGGDIVMTLALEISNADTGYSLFHRLCVLAGEVFEKVA